MPAGDLQFLSNDVSMKKQLVVILISLLAALVFLTGAAGATGLKPRPVVAFFYIDGLEASLVEKAAVKEQTVARFTREYAGNYEIRSGDGYSGVNRFTDLENLDRFDLLPRLKNDRIDYAVFYSLLPFRSKREGVFALPATESRVQVRVFGLRKNANVADVTLAYDSQWAWPGQHCEKLFEEADAKVFKGLFS